MIERKDEFTSGGVHITVECFEPHGSGPYPAIVALHGSNGMSNGAPLVRALSLPVVHQNFAVYVPHYFERTGTERSDPQTSRRYFLEWLQTAADAVGFASIQPAVDAERIGIIGISLGAFLGLSLATRDTRVGAVVDFFGGLPDAIGDTATRMAPTLILHGEADRIVSVDEAHKLERLLVKLGVAYEKKIYPNEGHVFSPFGALDAGARTIRFLQRHLARSPAP